jgi:hypothetical protein
MRIRWRLTAVSLAAGLLLGPSLPVFAQVSPGPCPIVTDALAAGALGGTVQTSATPNAAPGIDACDFVDGSGTDYAISRELGAFDPGEPTGPVILVLKYLPQLSDSAIPQLAALAQPGQTVTLPGYVISAVNGVGDAAVWIKAQSDSGAYDDSLLVQRGNDVFAFGAPDAPDTQTKLKNLAQAVLTNSQADGAGAQ